MTETQGGHRKDLFQASLFLGGDNVPPVFTERMSVSESMFPLFVRTPVVGD